MDPAILIVGAAPRRAALSGRIAALGYLVRECGLAELGSRVVDGEPPSAIMLCAEGPQAARVMSELRRTRRGLSIPVTLCGRLGGAIRDLADVLDLGADQFLEEPIDTSMLRATLRTLAGPASHETPEPDPATIVDARGLAYAGGDVSREDTLEGGASARETRTGVQDTASLGATLDRLGARLREVPGPEASESSDDMELSLLDLDPPSEEGPALGALPDPAQSRPDMLLTAVTPPPGTSRPGTELLDPREPTIAAGERSAAEGGSLADEEVPRLLWRLHRAGATGRLDLHPQGSAGPNTLWWDAGEVVGAQSTTDQGQLGAVMLRRGLISETDVNRVTALLRRDPSGKSLATSGLVKPAELPEIERARIRDTVVAAFGWRAGSWEWSAGEQHTSPLRLRRPLHRIIVDGVRTGLDGPALRERVAPDALPHCVDALALSTLDLGFSPETLRWVRTLGGHLTLNSVARSGGPQGDLALAYLYALHVLGIVAWERGPAEEEPSGVAAASTVDRTRILSRLRLVREADYFAILGLQRDAMSVDVQQAHAALQETFAPEQLEPEIPDELGLELDEIRLALDDACAVLKEDNLRLAYLAHLGTP